MTNITANVAHQTCLSLYSSAYDSTALCWAFVAFQLRNPMHSLWDSLDGESARRKAYTYTQNNTNTE
jgi:hypothetical protein